MRTRFSRPESARSEQGWNVAESQPSVGSKLKTEIAKDAAPIPDRPPVVTLVTVVSAIHPPSSFQNVYSAKVSQFRRSKQTEAKDFPGDNQGSMTRGFQNPRHLPHDQSFGRCRLHASVRGTEPKRSSSFRPIQVEPRYRSYRVTLTL